MHFTHLFWDFDGTLYNSYPHIVDSMLQTLQELGLPAPDPNEALGLLKKSVYYASCEYANRSHTDVQRIMAVFQRYHHRHVCFQAYEGLESCLKRLSDAGVRHYLYTHRDRAAIDQLKHDGLYHYFSDEVTREDAFADKPAPDALLALLRRNNIDPTHAAMVGDRDIDIRAGHNASMAGILFDPDGFYGELPVELRVRTMDELCRKVLAL